MSPVGIKSDRPNNALQPTAAKTRHRLNADVRPQNPMSVAHRLASLLIVLVPLRTIAGADVLSPHGYGLVRFGMKVEEAEQTLKQRTTKPYDATGCDYVEFKKYPRVQFMVEDGVVTRADATRNVRNSANVRVGMTLAPVRAMHPSVKIEPHKYDDSGHYLILEADDGRAAIVLEVGGGKVTDIRAGLKPAVEYVERCL